MYSVMLIHKEEGINWYSNKIIFQADENIK